MPKEGPPPINWATHPRRSALPSADAPAASTAPQPHFATEPTAPAAPSNSNSQTFTIDQTWLDSIIRTIDPAWLDSIIRSTPGLPYPRALLVTQMATALSSTMDGHDRSTVDGHDRSVTPRLDSLLVTQTATTSSIVDGRDSSVDLLTDALDGLSIQPATTPPPPPTPSVPVFVIPVNNRHGKAKYYSVIVGKCCSVYSSWSTVHPLVIGVSGSLYTGFPTYNAACDDYYAAKVAGNVRVVREPGDKFIYGPLSQACM